MKTINLPTEFTPSPEAFSLRVNLFGEIVSATNFNGANLYIRYLVELGDGWASGSSHLQLLSGYTQTSSCIYNTEIDAWEARFAYPVETELVSRQGIMPIIPFCNNCF
jgi:hypothetical protein